MWVIQVVASTDHLAVGFGHQVLQRETPHEFAWDRFSQHLVRVRPRVNLIEGEFVHGLESCDGDGDGEGGDGEGGGEGTKYARAWSRDRPAI